MTGAELKSLTIERFKSFEAKTRVEFAPLTIIIGRNNSGKSSLIQALLLLKQTLLDPRPEVSLGLEGIVDAFSLKELTFGWPDVISTGPTIAIEWESDVDVARALNTSKPNLGELADQSGVDWLRDPSLKVERLRTVMTLHTTETNQSTSVSRIELVSYRASSQSANVSITPHTDGRTSLSWNNQRASRIQVTLDHFLPYLSVNTRNLGPRAKERSWFNAFLVLFTQPLESLREALERFHYLGSLRQVPQSIYKPSTVSPNEIGVSGEYAAQLLHRRQKDIVHFLLPTVMDNAPSSGREDSVLARSMVNAVNDVMKSLSVNAPVSVESIQDLGFRLFFGQASLLHVGRGLNHLLPIVELGLFADPIRFTGSEGEMPLTEYNERCASLTHVALEEPEAHLHPKVASRLAHWLVSLARSSRRLIVETHSDHLVRRLRGLAARAPGNSSLERWLTTNVVILSVEQDPAGRSTITSSRLTSDGGVSEVWPSEFMDEATNEESAIYYAKLGKTADEADVLQVSFIEGDEPEAEEAP